MGDVYRSLGGDVGTISRRKNKGHPSGWRKVPSTPRMVVGKAWSATRGSEGYYQGFRANQEYH